MDGHEMVVIDISSRQVTGRVDSLATVLARPLLPGVRSGEWHALRDHGAGPDGDYTHSKTLKIVGTVPTGAKESHMLVISRNGQRGYTSNVGAGSVSVLDLPGRKTIAVIPVSSEAQRIAISNDDKMVFTSDQPKPQLAVIDTATNKIKTWVPLPAVGYGTSPTPDGRFLLVAMPKANQLAVVDLGTLKVVRTVDVPEDPVKVLARPDGKVAYVSCSRAKQVAVVDLSQWKVDSLIDAGKGVDGLAGRCRPPRAHRTPIASRRLDGEPESKPETPPDPFGKPDALRGRKKRPPPPCYREISDFPVKDFIVSAPPDSVSRTALRKTALYVSIAAWRQNGRFRRLGYACRVLRHYRGAHGRPHRRGPVRRQPHGRHSVPRAGLIGCDSGPLDERRIEAGHRSSAIFSAMLYPQGTFVDDILVHKFSDNDYLLVINAGTREKDYQWIRSQVGSFAGVHISDYSDHYTQLAIQGPRAQDTLAKLTKKDLGAIKNYWFTGAPSVACPTP